MTLIAIIIANILPSLKGFSDDYFFRKYEFHLASIRIGQQYRMLSSGFLHVDLSHLAFNMLTLYLFADDVIINLNDAGFLFIYFFSLLAGSVLSLYFHQNEPHYRAVGASGAVTGIVYSSILFEPHNLFYGFIPAYIFGIIYLFYSIYGMKNRGDNIGHSAHFGGAIGGFVATLFMQPSLITEKPIIVSLLLIPIFVLFIIHNKNKI